MQLSKPNYQVFSTILLGFLLFGLKDFAGLISGSLPRIIALIGLIFIFISPFYYKYKIVNGLNKKIRIFFYAYLCWLVLIMIRPLFLGQSYTADSIHPYAIHGLTSYLTPFVVLLGVGIISLRKMFKIIFIFSIIGGVFFVLNYNVMLSTLLEGETMSFDGKIGLGELANSYSFWFSISTLSLLCYEFVPMRYKWSAIFTAVFMGFLYLLFGRRGGVFMSILYFSGMFYLYLEQSKSSFRFVKMIFVVAIMTVAYLLVKNYSDSFFSIFYDRLFEDSRGRVEQALIKTLDKEDVWLYGKGIEGTYEERHFKDPRYAHETGYLYLILKGGILYLFFYVSLLLHAAYLGFFKTRNRLTKALALYVFFSYCFFNPFWTSQL